MKRAASKLLLLDVNVLLALAWPNHQFHDVATTRLTESNSRWATCALTQLDFIRLSANPAVVGSAVTAAEAAALLAEMTADRRHEFLDRLPAPASKGWATALDRVLGYRQTTDAYLLRLAEMAGAALVTFDARLPALAGEAAAVEVLGV